MIADCSQPFRVCHVVLSLRPGGLENGVVNVINGLDRREFVSSICCLQERGRFADRITDERCQILEFGLRPGNDLRLPWRLARAFTRLRPDIIHTRNAEAFFYGCIAARLAGIRPLVHSEHGRVFPEKWHRALMQRLLLRRATFAFAVSRRLADDMVAQIGVPPGFFEVIYNGVDTRAFSARARDRYPRGELLIGSVGRLVKVKNYGLLLRAVAQLPREQPWRLALLGDGPERENLEALVRQLDLGERVMLPGHREDIGSWLARMDIFVLPSVSEGMSNTLLEAMAAGVAVVASNVGGNGEIVEHGRSGLLFESNNLGAVVREIESLVTDGELRARLAAAGAERVEKTFSMRSMVEAYQDLYRNAWRKMNESASKSVVA